MILMAPPDFPGMGNPPWLPPGCQSCIPIDSIDILLVVTSLALGVIFLINDKINKRKNW